MTFRPALLAILVAISAACAAASTETPSAPPVDAAPDASADSRRSADPDGWGDTRTIAQPEFRIDVPRGVRATRREEDEGYDLLLKGFPGCGNECWIDVNARTLAEPWDVDRLEREIDAATAEDGIAPEPRERVTIGGEPAVKLHMACGDCTVVQYVLVRGRTQVGLLVNVNATVPPEKIQALLPRFEAVVSTFRWAEGR